MIGSAGPDAGRSPLVLYRLRGPLEAERDWVSLNSLATLAAERPDEYQVREFLPDVAADARGGRGAIVVRVDGNPIQLLGWTLAQPGVRAWIAGGGTIVFDHSTEISLSGPAPWKALGNTLRKEDAPPTRLVWLGQNEHGPRDCGLHFDGQGRHRVSAMAFHYWMHRTRTGVTETPARPDGRLRERRFLSLNFKPRAHRAAILGWLSEQGLLELGLVSIPRPDGEAKSFKWPSVEAFIADADASLPGFGKQIEGCRRLSAEGLVLGDGQALERKIPWDLHARTGFSLVSETEMRGRETLRFTEKTLKALAAWHPAIVAGNMGVLKLLRDFGFQTFSPWIDESYDLIEAPSERLRAVLTEAKRLITMPEDAFERLLDDLDEVLSHNHRHFMEGLPAIMDRQHEAFRQAVVALSAAGR